MQNQAESKSKNYKKKFQYSFDIKSYEPQEDGFLKIKGIASFEDWDRDKELIKMEAIQKRIQDWMTNPIIKYMHKDTVGKGVPEESGIMGKQFEVSALIGNETFAQKECTALIRQGILKCFSIGGIVHARDNKDKGIITDIETLEISVVDIPSNKGSMFNVITKAAKSLLEKEDDDEEEDDESLFEEENSGVKSHEYKNNKKEGRKMEGEEDNTSSGQNPTKSTDTLKAAFKTCVEDNQDKADPEAYCRDQMEGKSAENLTSETVAKLVKEGVEAGIKELVSSKPFRKAFLEGQDSTGSDTSVKLPSSYVATEFGHETFYTKGLEGGSQTKDVGTEDLRKGVSFRESYSIAKATTSETGGTGTAGFALVPVYVDPDIIDRTRREIPFIELVARRAVQGLTYDYNAITALTNAVELNEDAALNDLTDTYDRLSVTIRWMYSTGRVTGQAIAARRGYVDALSEEVKNRTLGLKRREDQLALTTNSAPSWDGLAGLITTNVTALSGPLTISAMRTEIDQCRDAGGVINLIVTTNTLSSSLKGLLNDYQRYVDSTRIAWGIETMSFDGIPVIVDRYATSGYVYFLDMSVIFMAVLQDMVYEELAKTNDSVKFTLKMYEALVVRAEAFCSILTGAT